MSGGREKIIVIRNEVKDTEVKTSDVFFDTEGGDLKKMNAPKVVRELEIKKRDLGHPIKIDRKVEINTTPDTEKK